MSYFYSLHVSFKKMFKDLVIKVVCKSKQTLKNLLRNLKDKSNFQKVCHIRQKL